VTHYFLKFIFLNFFLSIIRSLILYKQQLVYIIQVMLTAGWNILIPLAIRQHKLYDIYLLLLKMDTETVRNM